MVMFKQKGVWLVLAALLMVASLTSTAFARTAPGTVLPAPPKVMSQQELNANAWFIWTTNYGPFCNPQANSGGFWRDRAYSYIFGAGMYVGAEDDYGNKIVAVGYNPNSGDHEFGPVSLADTSYEKYLSDAGARVYLSSNAADFAAWPVTEGGKKVIRSRQDSYSLFSDENPAFTTSGDKRLGVAVAQHSYAWNYADNNDIVFFYFKVHNISGSLLKNVYVGPCNDCDIGNEAEGLANDRTAFDYTRNLAMQFQNTPEPGWDKTGVVGFRYFESPLNNTGATVNVIDNQYSHSILPDSALGMTAFKIFTIEQDPATDEDRYLEMTGINYWNLTMDAYDEWGATSAGDKRFLMSSGPFNLPAGAFVTTCIGVIGALDTTALKDASDIAQSIYDNNFQLATPPAAPTLTVTPSDKQVLLSWDRKAETTPDPYWENLPDTAGWYAYFPGSWVWLPAASQLLVDAFTVKINDSTSAYIARGAVNPGTDTLYAHYNQRDLYVQYDFQGYKIYRARTMIALADAATREPLGTIYANTETAFNTTTLSYPGGSGYFYDKKDGIQIVKSLNPITLQSPEGVTLLAKYDTLGSDRGLIYTIIDSNVVNGFGWYYGVTAYDYQNNVYFTHKCPTTLASNPTENAVYSAARTPTSDIIAANVQYTVTGPSDYRTGGTVDYEYRLTPIPSEVNNDTFRLVWNPTTKIRLSNINHPVYTGELRDMRPIYGDSLLQTINFQPDYRTSDQIFLGSGDDEILFGGLVFNFNYEYDHTKALVETVKVNSGTYPEDSIWALAYGAANSFFTPAVNSWQWRGSNYEIRWYDSIGTVGTNPSGSILCATVWDLDNNIEVPLESGVTKANMTQSSWCTNIAATVCNRYVDSLSLTSYGMYIAGINLFFNRRDGGTMRRMVWSERPHTDDTWTVYCAGPGNPMEGGMATFITTPSIQVANPMASLLDAIKVVPNPYLVRHNWDVSKNYPNIHFTHLPAKCTIRIFNLAGDLVRVLRHESSYDDNNGIEKWDLLTTFDKRPASGVYIYQIDAPGIGTKLGKFAIIK